MLRFLIAIVGLVLCHAVAFSQIERGRTIVQNGTHFLVAFPQNWTLPTENPLPSPLRLRISSTDSAEVRVRSLRVTSPSIDRVYRIEPNSVFMVSIPLGFMHTQSETIGDYGIEVTSNVPISVTSSMAWQGGGDNSIHHPVSAWGTSYRAISLYQDSFGKPGNVEYRPGQILVIAAQDDTRVTYTPTVDTEGGGSAPSTKKGESRTVTLKRGETFLIRAKTDPTINKDKASDLTGTHITSTKPIGVLSGHTKGAIGRMPDVLPPTGTFAGSAHFVRNAIHEAVTPDHQAGSEFVIIPSLYTPTRVVGTAVTEFGMDDDRGDVVRIIAIEDGTVIERYTAKAGQQWRSQGTFNAGESFQDFVVQDPTMFRTSKPAHCYQYGKAFARVAPPPMKGTGKDVEDAMAYPTVEAGMPMLQSVPPTDRWIQNAVFTSDEGMDNFMAVVYPTVGSSSIVFDGKPLSIFTNAKEIVGTPFSYLAMNVSAGSHKINSNSDSVFFCAWSYGSLDGLNQGRAYGHVVGMSYNESCADSLSVSYTTECGSVEGMFSLHGDECAKFSSINSVHATNATVLMGDWQTPGARVGSFKATLVNSGLPAQLVLRAQSTSGRFVSVTINIPAVARPITTDNVFDVGEVDVARSKDTTITIVNSFPDTLRFTPVILGYHPNLDLVDTSQVVIPPMDSVGLEIRAIGREEGIFRDTLVALGPCGTTSVLARILSSNYRIVLSTDSIDFGTTGSTVQEQAAYVRNQKRRGIMLIGYSSEYLAGPAEVIALELPRGTPIETVSLPMAIEAEGSLEIFVRFTPGNTSGLVRQIHRFALSTADTLTMVIQAFIDPQTSVTGETAAPPSLSIQVAPQPITGESTILIQGLTPGLAQVTLYSVSGSTVIEETLTGLSPNAQIRSVALNTAPSGAYILRVLQGTQSASVRVQVLR